MSKHATNRMLAEFPKSVIDGTGAIFLGAGASISAGYPSWIGLLRDIGSELGVESKDIQDLAALAQWSIQESGGATRVRNVIKEKIGKEYPVPESIATIARLPVRHIWTTNYDRLVERAYQAINRPIDAISGAKDLSLKSTPGATRLYKMHGSIERLDDIVISTDDYELYRSKRGAFLPLLQAHLTSMSMLFVGLSFTDPNVRHVLSLIRESFTDAPPEHFAIVRPPHRGDFDSQEEFNARLTQHNLWAKDLKRYGLVAVEIDDYDEVPILLKQIERRVASRRVWISGSWPIEDQSPNAKKNYELAEKIGAWIGTSNRDLVSGDGLLIGPAALSGFLASLRSGGGWDLEQRLIVRPFPRPEESLHSSKDIWTYLRKELARYSGIVIFIGGLKAAGESKSFLLADGVLEEFNIAKESQVFLLPISATGGAAKEISDQLLGSNLLSEGPSALRPTDDELRLLSDAHTPIDQLVNCVSKIIARITSL